MGNQTSSLTCNSNKEQTFVSKSFHNRDQEYELKRSVFVSIVGLHQTWKNAPIYTLHTCICILPIAMDWICNNNKLKFPSNDCDIPAHLQTILKDKSFARFLLFKDEQKLLFCMEDYHQKSRINLHFKVVSFWSDFSVFLTKLYDPIEPKKCYNPLVLETKYWKYQSPTTAFNVESRIGDVDCFDVLNEINHLTMSFRAIKQILQEFNPSLNVLLFGYHFDGSKRNVNNANDMGLSDDWVVCDSYMI